MWEGLLIHVGGAIIQVGGAIDTGGWGYQYSQGLNLGLPNTSQMLLTLSHQVLV